MHNNANSKSDAVLEPALVDEQTGATFLSLSRRGFRQIVDRGEIRQVRIPGMRRVAYNVEELRAVARRWKG